MSLHEIIRNRSVRQGLSIADLSETTGINYSTLSKFFRGTRTLDSDRLNTLLKALDFNLEDNLCSSEEKAKPKYMKNYLAAIEGVLFGRA